MGLINTQYLTENIMEKLTERRKVNVPLKDVTKHRVKGFFTGIAMGLILISVISVAVYMLLFF